MSNFYILDGKIPIPAPDAGTWGRWMEDAGQSRVVKQETVGTLWVSTVFLGLDHSYGLGQPALFETMVFANKPPKALSEDLYLERCSTWELALEQHRTAVQWAKERAKKP